MRYSFIDIFVGIFLIVGFAALGWLAVQLGEVPWLTGTTSYRINAEFSNVSGVTSGADVQIAGVKVGTVLDLTLNEDGYARVAMQVDNDVEIPVDSIASVKSKGIIGDKVIEITLGGDVDVFKEGGLITDTESAVDIESLISKFAFGRVEE
jgi:phospholipid/cholesterol/gamma-HCH transport system substrate-binding protein